MIAKRLTYKKSAFITIFSVVMAFLLSSCAGGRGGSKVYENGYESGYNMGQSSARYIARDNKADLKYNNPEDYGGASEAYEMVKYEAENNPTNQFDFDGPDGDDYRDGFIDGYIDGFNKVKKDNGFSVSSKSKKSHSSSGSNGSGGLTFWGWLLVPIGAMIVYVGIPSCFGMREVETSSDSEDPTYQPSVTTTVTYKDTNPSTGDTLSHKVKKESIFKPRGAMVAAFVGLWAMGLTTTGYNCTPHTWSFYYLTIVAFIGNLGCIGMIMSWREAVRKSAASMVALVFGWIILIFYVVRFIFGIIALFS